MTLHSYTQYCYKKLYIVFTASSIIIAWFLVIDTPNGHSDNDIKATTINRGLSEKDVITTKIINGHSDNDIKTTTIANHHSDNDIKTTTVANDNNIKATTITDGHSDNGVRATTMPANLQSTLKQNRMDNLHGECI